MTKAQLMAKLKMLEEIAEAQAYVAANPTVKHLPKLVVIRKVEGRKA